MAGQFQSSRFKVRLESDDGDQRVTVVIGVDGLKVMNEAGSMTMRSLDLKHISRWGGGRGGREGDGWVGAAEDRGRAQAAGGAGVPHARPSRSERHGRPGAVGPQRTGALLASGVRPPNANSKPNPPPSPPPPRRWSTIGGGSLVIYTQTPVDLEERQLLLSGDARTIQNLLDTLTCCCMQLAELLQSGRGDDAEAGSHLGGLVAGGGRRRTAAPQLPAADAVEYWRAPEKAGWLHSQGDVVKTWRRRWMVLKQGYLFRFMGPDPSERDRPRGVVDLSQVQDVRDGRSATGRTNSIQLLTAKGASVCFLCDTGARGGLRVGVWVDLGWVFTPAACGSSRPPAPLFSASTFPHSPRVFGAAPPPPFPPPHPPRRD